MVGELVVHLLVGLAPVLCFLATLLYLDSYKLVSLRLVIAVVVCGIIAAGACYVANAELLHVVALDRQSYTRYVAPVIEEFAKALIVVALVRGHRIGFLVDAAILGFAAGTGFALVENVYYQRLIPDAGLGTWFVRGFGTAFMHGGTTAVFAMMGLALSEQHERSLAGAFAPGFVVAVILHSAFNHLVATPRIASIASLIVLPPLLYLVFQRSERAVADWLGRGFDADARMLETINSGGFRESPAGQYLTSLKERFHGPIVADLLSYLRLYTELALRAKGILLMRENGFEPVIDDETRARFAEMRYLEKSIGRTGLMAIHPMLHMSRRDLWQLYMLEAP
jgi:RsiW-degrading membrane proteinase PrsW (M82 family)